MLRKLWSRLATSRVDPDWESTPPKAVLLAPDPVVSDLLIDTLEHEGFDVCPVRTASEIALLARRETVDLALLDSAGNPSTLQTIRELRSFAGPNELSIVVVGDRDDAAMVASTWIAAGADDCLEPPLALSEVRSRIRARLHGRGRLAGREPSAELAVGAVLEGRFRLEAELGRGNFGTVYSATHLSLKRQVAIKVLRDKFATRDEMLRRLQLEGVSTCQIDHPNAVKVFDLSLTRGGDPYLVMELLHGRNLKEELASAPSSRLTIARAAEILAPVCRVLVASHRVGMLHLDIKPANIFLHEPRPERSVVKVLDFGIVRMVSGEGRDGLEVVESQSFEGTPHYASLERLMAEPFGPKADVFSVGVVLFELLAGRRPFRGAKTPLHLINLLMHETYPAIETLVPDLPEAVVDLCSRCLRSDPAARPTAVEVAECLEPMAQPREVDV